VVARHKIQDLIEEGKIAVTDEAPPIAPNPNEKVGVLKDPLPSHLPSASAFSQSFLSTSLNRLLS